MSCLLHPTYFPNIFHFAVIQSYKGHVTWEVHDHFQKQTFRNRCEICTDSGKLKLSAPTIHKKKQAHQKISEVELEYKTLWYRIHWKSITTAYRSSPYFEFYEDELNALFEKKYATLIELNLNSIHFFAKQLNLQLSESYTTSFKQESDSDDYRFLVNTKYKLNYTTMPQYTQVFADRHGFIENASMLDLLFNLGPNTSDYLSEIKINELKT
ncbi:MAG: hypothetical protein CMC18_05075 [Flavobacteriaceae bacterium]|nr:hypothetical protein [Flavobacteriaceae bacterium]|tara:strand:- start:7002 stop:7637 length:636 start_codon:yes stop_codon:yes gene_type:complete